MSPRHRRFLKRALSPLALLLLLGPGTARAEVETGADAPDVTAGAQLNIEPVTLAGLKGRLIFLELFTTT
jgi:hypothetical protein